MISSRMRWTSRISSSVRRTSSLLRSMVSSGSTNSVWPLDAGAVDHAVELAALPGDDRHHEALVADGDELLLQHAFFAVRAQKAFERFLDGAFLALDVAAQAGQRHAGVVGDAAVGQDLAFQIFAAARENRRWSGRAGPVAGNARRPR